MKELQYEILPGEQRQLLNILKAQAWLSSFYLAGGTSLALQIGHRVSVDFDFFCTRDFSLDFIKQNLSSIGKFIPYQEEKNTLHGELNNVKITFLGYKYKLLEKYHSVDSFNIAGLKDLACMKLSAIMSRGEKKDFIDLYYLLNLFTLEEMFAFYHRKYQVQGADYMILKSLVYFSDADHDPMPAMKDKKIKWETIKNKIMKQVREYKLG